MGFINTLINFLVYDDGAETNNPKIRLADITRQLISIPTTNAFSRNFAVPPASTKTVATTLRTISQDATTQYTVSLISGSKYRWLFAGGTNPVLRTDRAFAYNALTQFDVTKTGSIVRYTFDGTGTPPLFVSNGVVVGDIVHIQSGSAFNALNEGTFTIVKIDETYFEVVNASGVAESNIAMGANINGAAAMIIYSAAGVQIGDQVKITATAYSVENRGVFTVTEVTSKFFELSNGNPGIPEGPTAVGSASGIVFYDDLFSWAYIEADQDVSVRLNGDTTDNVVVTPVVPADASNPGVFLFHGDITQVVIANNGDATAQVKVVLAE